MTVAGQLIEEVKATGADIAQAQLVAMGVASDAASVSLDTVVVSSTALARNMAELSAMTAEGAASLGTLAGAEDVTGASTDALNVQFAAMRARLAEVGVQADAEAVQMRANYVAHKALSDVAGVAGKALAGLRDVMVTLIKTVAEVTLVTSAVALVLGGIAAYAAAQFQQNLLKLYTTAGEAKSALAGVGQGILTMSTQVGTGANELLKAMYWVESAGFHGAAGLNVLRIAAEAAKTENSDLMGVAHALTGVLNTYASTNITAAQAMNVLIGSVGQGATTLNEMADAISNVLPAGSKFHLQLIDLTTAIATMTNQNDNAASAATHLRQVILALESPAKAGAKALAEIGLSADDLHAAMSKSLPGAIQLIIDLLGKKFPEGSAAYNDALKAISGGNKQLLGLLELSGVSLGKWKAAVVAVTGDVKAGGNAVMGWADVQKNFNFRMGEAWAATQALFISVGTQLLPVLTQLANIIIPIIANFANWVTKAQPLSTLIDQIGQAFQAVFGPVQQVNTAMKPLVDTFDRATGALHAIKSAVDPLAAIFTQIGGVFTMTQNAAHPMLDSFDRATSIFHKTSDAANPLVPIFQWIATAIKNVGKAWNDMQPAFQYIKDNLLPALKTLGDVIKQTVVPAFQQFVIAIQPLVPILKQLAPLLLPLFVAIAKGVLGALVFIALLVAGFTWIITTIINVETWVQTACKNIVGFFKGLYHDLVGGSVIPELIAAMVANFASLPGKIMAAIASLPGKMAALFLSIAAAAVGWGSSIINGFLAGLQRAWQAVVSWVTQALAWLASQFPHSPVKDGPLKGSEMWGYNFMKNIADGMKAGMPLVQSALAGLGGGMGSLGISHSFSGSSGIASSFGGGGGSPVIVNKIYIQSPVYLDSRQLAEGVGPQLVRSIQLQTGFRKPT